VSFGPVKRPAAREDGYTESADGRLQPQPARTGYECSVASTFAEASALSDEWHELFVASGTPNGFANPRWLLAWAEVYVDDGDLCVLSVRADGRLVAVAPFHRVRLNQRPIARPPFVRILRPLGISRSTEITELPEILTLDPAGKKLLPVVIRGLIDLVDSWDWLELTLTPEQGWLDPEWIARFGQPSGFVEFHKRTRACVVAPLAPDWETYRAGLGRNVRESIRRGENRLRRAGHEWRLIEDFDGPRELEAAVDQLTALHRARAELRRGPCHPSYLESADAREFLSRATSLLSGTNEARPVLLEVDGRVVAARLLLHAGDSTFFSISGFDPDWWDFGVATTLVAGALRGCMARGDATANLSTGPERSKLRWSNELRLYQDFVLVRRRRRSSVAFQTYWTARAATHLHRHRWLHGPSK
jgi:CelD/BcsL family acetyltransferase involved in cellulose biosynthesis